AATVPEPTTSRPEAPPRQSPGPSRQAGAARRMRNLPISGRHCAALACPGLPSGAPSGLRLERSVGDRSNTRVTPTARWRDGGTSRGRETLTPTPHDSPPLVTSVTDV